MSDLRDPLDDLLADVPTYVVPDARAAWAAGARRRTRHRIGVVGAACVVVALLAGAVAWLPRIVEPQPADSDGGAGAFPTRIDYAYWSRELPDSGTGPLAGILERVDERDSFDDPLGWYAVTPSGRLWEIADADWSYQPALSPDGLQVAYLNTDAGQSFEVRDLVGGTVTSENIVAAERSANAGTRSGAFRLVPQMPSYWSPDSRRLLVQVGNRGHVVLVGTGGRPMQEVRTGLPAWSAGWVDPATLAWLRIRDAGGVEVVLTDLRGEVIRTVALQVPTGASFGGQWAGTVSADGSSIALQSDDPLHTTVSTYSLATGEQVGDPVTGLEVASTCTMSWAGDDVLVPASGDDGVLLADADGRPTVMADPRLGSRCSQWASSAVSGDDRSGIGGTIFGTSNSWLSWHWREIGIAVLACAGFILVVVLWNRRRKVYRLG